MKLYCNFFFVSLCLINISCSLLSKEDYIGVYRIIKIIENDETIKATTLNQIELTENMYISSIDRNGDNKFSINEIEKSTYVFDVDENNNPYIIVTGNDSVVLLLADNYYDLLFRRINTTGLITDVYLRKVR